MHLTPWLLATAAGIIWGLTPPTPAGALLGLLGAGLLGPAMIGRPLTDALRFGIAFALWALIGGTWVIDTFDAWGDPWGVEAFQLVVAAYTVSGLLHGLAAGWFLRRGLPPALALALTALSVGWLHGALHPIPVTPGWLLGGFTGGAAIAAFTGHAGCWAALLALPRLRNPAAIGSAGLIFVALAQLPPTGGTSYTVGIVETGVDLWTVQQHSAQDRRAAALHDAAQRIGAVDLVLTPEGAWPYDLRAGGADALARWWPHHPPLLLGGDDLHHRHNAIALVESGDLIDTIAKHALVPSLETASYQPGDGAILLHPAGVPVATLICYEDLMWTRLWRVARSDAALLALPTSNVSIGPEVSRWHLLGARLAAASTGRWAVRAAVTGPSAVIDPRGELHALSSWRASHIDASPSHLLGEVRLRQPGWTGLHSGALFAIFAPLLALAHRRQT